MRSEGIQVHSLYSFCLGVAHVCPPWTHNIVFAIDGTFGYFKMEINSWFSKVKLLPIQELYNISRQQ